MKYESVIRADKIYSLSQAIVLKKFGAVKKRVMQLISFSKIMITFIA